jgi:hypothetical protein
MAFSQVTDQEKLENQKYYQTFIKDNISYMREYVDSTNIKMMLNQMDQINDKIGEELEKIVVTPDEIVVDTAYAVSEEISEDDMETDDKDVTLMGDNENERITDIFTNTENSDEETPLDKFIPGRKNKDKRTKTYLMINYGLNFFGSTSGSGTAPVVKPFSSWFWEYGIQSKVRLGKPGSKTSFLVGISYLKNRFTWKNDVLLSKVNDTPVWTEELLLVDSPKLRVGYITVPMGLRFKLSKKSSLDLGGYLGYRLFTSQTHKYKTTEELVFLKRRGDYSFDDWVYGATLTLKIMDTRLMAKYNFSNLIKDNENFNTNLIMIGLMGLI